jgi:periplasmic divalent cation tolerance protein
MTDVRTVYVTAADEHQAADLARALLARGLIACANLLPRVRSLYLWQGEVQDEPEVAMLLKTRQDRLEELIAAVLELHPYEEPCAVAWPIDAGSEGYLAWVREACAP